MALAFSFPAIIINKKSFNKAIVGKIFSQDQTDFIKHLSSSKMQDDYLIGIESMSHNFLLEINLLKDIGLTWNDGNKVIDFYVSNEGNFFSEWLCYAKINLTTNIFLSSYKHIEDIDSNVVGFEDDINLSFPSNSLKLDRRNWAKIAKDEGCKLYKPTFDEFIFEITKNNRICPIPKFWNDLYSIVIDSDFNEHQSPSLPLILGAWWDTSDSDKSERLKDLINWCFKANVADVAWAYISQLKDSEWHYAS